MLRNRVKKHAKSIKSNEVMCAKGNQVQRVTRFKRESETQTTHKNSNRIRKTANQPKFNEIIGQFD